MDTHQKQAVDQLLATRRTAKGRSIKNGTVLVAVTLLVYLVNRYVVPGPEGLFDGSALGITLEVIFLALLVSMAVFVLTDCKLFNSHWRRLDKLKVDYLNEFVAPELSEKVEWLFSSHRAKAEKPYLTTFSYYIKLGVNANQVYFHVIRHYDPYYSEPSRLFTDIDRMADHLNKGGRKITVGY